MKISSDLAKRKSTGGIFRKCLFRILPGTPFITHNINLSWVSSVRRGKYRENTTIRLLPLPSKSFPSGVTSSVGQYDVCGGPQLCYRPDSTVRATGQRQGSTVLSSLQETSSLLQTVPSTAILPFGPSGTHVHVFKARHCLRSVRLLPSFVCPNFPRRTAQKTLCLTDLPFSTIGHSTSVLPSLTILSRPICA